MGATEIGLLREQVLERLLAPAAAPGQPPLLEAPGTSLNAAIGSLALGGAERIVLDWAERCAAGYRVRLVALRDAGNEWPAPAGIELVRLHGTDLHARLGDLGARFAAEGNRVVLCHLLKRDERRALARGGALPIPVLHNARAGWIEPADALAGASHILAVSRSAAAEAREGGWRGAFTVIPHLPRSPERRRDAGAFWRARWALPPNAFVVGMIGAVKPQKAYPRALRILAALLARFPAYLVIVGGPAGRDGDVAWRAVLEQARRLGVAPFVRLPGYVRDASRCLPAFDVFLNTSRYEGRSIATLEALAAGMPVIASEVGGQAEIPAPGLALLAFDAPDADWAEGIARLRDRRPEAPAWIGFPSHRLWTLCHLAGPYRPLERVLFVTANLNAGGAQRSLANLAVALRDRMSLEIAVCGHSTSDAFARALFLAGVPHFRTADSRDCFDDAEALLRRIAATSPAIVCFWNVDPKVKLLLVKALGFARVKFVDVSPGAYAFKEMHATRDFQQWIAFSEDEYYSRLDRLVLKFRAGVPEGVRARTAVIANGVPPAPQNKLHFDSRSPKFAVSGRIAPTKFLLETVAAMRMVWRRFPGAELHLLGCAEPRHRDYASELIEVCGEELDRRIVFHGPAFDAPQRLVQFDAAIVLGRHQGCPNAVLEALAAGVPVVANDSGGTRELVLHERTGLLLRDRDPQTIAAAMERLLSDPALAQRLSRSGRAHVMRNFSMRKMAGAYLRLFHSL